MMCPHFGKARTNALATPTTRSRITNRSKLLERVDGRTREARRYRDLVKSFTGDLGDLRRDAGPSEAERGMVRQAAGLTLQAELLQAATLRGEQDGPAGWAGCLSSL